VKQEEKKNTTSYKLKKRSECVTEEEKCEAEKKKNIRR